MGDVKPVIAVIDDEQDVTAYLQAALSDEGFSVVCADDGNAGLALVRDRHPDLVCLDLLMPASTGLSLYRAMRTDPTLASVPVIIVSGLGVESALGEVLDGLPGPEAYVEKPIVLDRLVEAIRRLVGRNGET